MDWGQDLRYLRWWLDENLPRKDHLYFAYFGCFDPSHVGLKNALPIDCIDGANREATVTPTHQIPRHDWIAISVSFLKGNRWPARDGLQDDFRPV